MIRTAASSSLHRHDVVVSAQVWKRARGEAHVTFRCPWCDVVCASEVHGRHEQRRDVWLLVGCAHVPCGRGVLIRVPDASPWPELDTGEDGLLLAPNCVHPRS